MISSVQVWDRYLLLLTPSFVLLVAGMGSVNGAGRLYRAAGSLLLAGSLIVPARTAAQGGFPIGGDHGATVGLEEAVTWLRNQAPADAILYHRVLGWQLRFYLFDENSSWPDATALELRWYPNAVYLADNAAKDPHRRKFIIQPDWAPLPGAAPRLRQRRVQRIERFRAGHFRVYELVLPPGEYC
ncbi:MAG: hypothetical protein D6790_13550, partial [Caldilineae bacterium]